MDESDVYIFSRALKQYSEQMETTFKRGFKKYFLHMHTQYGSVYTEDPNT